MKEDKSLGSFIKDARKNKKLSQNALAIKLNTTQQSIANWEKDKNKPDVSILQKLCEILELDYHNITEKYYNKKDNSKRFLKIKKRVLFLIAISLFIICPIIIGLFIFNRNKIYIYYGNIASSTITMSDTLFIETNDKYIIKLGNILTDSDNYSKIRIYYKGGSKDKTIAEQNYDNNLYIMLEKNNANIGNDFDIENVYIDIYSKEGDIYTSKIVFHILYKYEDIFSSSIGAYY